QLRREVLRTETAVVQQVRLRAVPKTEVFRSVAVHVIGGPDARAEVECELLGAFDLRDPRFHPLARRQREADCRAYESPQAAVFGVQADRDIVEPARDRDERPLVPADI